MHSTMTSANFFEVLVVTAFFYLTVVSMKPAACCCHFSERSLLTVFTVTVWITIGQISREIIYRLKILMQKNSFAKKRQNKTNIFLRKSQYISSSIAHVS